MPFGLTNAPAAFQKEMKAIFRELPYVSVYLDDIIVFSKDATKHAAHLRQVMELLREIKMQCKLSKCSFFEKEASFLGYVISGQGIRIDPIKVQAEVDWPEQKPVHELQSFLGLGNF